MTDPEQIRDEHGWRWSWNGWLSAPHEMLEVRPWTPLPIAGRLCFCAKDGDKWSVSWGDDAGPLLDDAYDVTDCGGKPLYVARMASKYFLIWWDQRTPDFDYQISYRVHDGSPIAVTLSTWRPSSDGRPREKGWITLETDWRALGNS